MPIRRYDDMTMMIYTGIYITISSRHAPVRGSHIPVFANSGAINHAHASHAPVIQIRDLCCSSTALDHWHASCCSHLSDLSPSGLISA